MPRPFIKTVCGGRVVVRPFITIVLLDLTDANGVLAGVTLKIGGARRLAEQLLRASTQAQQVARRRSRK